MSVYNFKKYISTTQTTRQITHTYTQKGCFFFITITGAHHLIIPLTPNENVIGILCIFSAVLFHNPSVRVLVDPYKL